VALALYGDNKPKGLPVGSTADLGVTLAAIGRRLAEARG
jgi:hypothetical protein